MATGDPICPRCGQYLSNSDDFLGRHECPGKWPEVTFYGPGFLCAKCAKKDATIAELRKLCGEADLLLGELPTLGISATLHRWSATWRQKWRETLDGKEET